MTAAEALVSMVAALGVGVAAGRALRSRWSMLVVPAVFLAVFEFARLGVDGPSVDAIRLGSLVGWLTFFAGRGFHGLLVLVPMALGCYLGVVWAARDGHAARAGRPGLVVAGLVTLGLVALAVAVARPASTAPILGAGGETLPGSIAELATVRIGGHDQAVMLRGTSARNPVLLHLAGGPGGTDVGAMRLDAGLEQDFVVATWDQRGAGKSYPALDPTSTLTVEQVVADTIAVTEYLRERFGEERIVITGQSWGTIPATLAVQRRPDLYLAYVGTGQMVDVLETDRAFYDDTLAWAEQRGDADLADSLRELGPPPYEDLFDYVVVGGYERDLNAYPEFDGRTEMTTTIFVPENSLVDTVNAVRGLTDTFAVLYPQLQGLDLRAEVPRLEVPVYVVMGEHEARGRTEPAAGWFEGLEAPVKEWVEFPASSHRASFEQPAMYAELLREVLAGATR